MIRQSPTVENTAKVANFVRRFFLFISSRNIPNAILHGGFDGFEHKLTDVDFAVDRASFPALPILINKYCEQSGWKLCQILRHETTAAYFVCSAADDPSCAIALDACSDYQRNGTLFLTADELLGNRRQLPWGGHGLDESIELRYRFAKAAAKGKDAAHCAVEFANHPDDVREECAAWLESRWDISLGQWNQASLEDALSALQKQCNSRPSLFQQGALSRIRSRIMNPTGLIIITGCDWFDNACDQLMPVFGHLYFRQVQKAGRLTPLIYRKLIYSTIIITPDSPSYLQHVLPSDCIFRPNQITAESGLIQACASFLQRRCLTREGICP